MQERDKYEQFNGWLSSVISGWRKPGFPMKWVAPGWVRELPCGCERRKGNPMFLVALDKKGVVRHDAKGCGKVIRENPATTQVRVIALVQRLPDDDADRTVHGSHLD